MKVNLKKVEKELKRLGWSRSDFARKMKISRQLCHYYFTRPIKSFKIVERMAKALDIDPIDLLK